MTMNDSATLELKEYQPRLVAHADLSPDDGEYLFRQYAQQVDVEFPSPKTDHQWRLTANGWVGYIPLPSGKGIYIAPKVPIHNLFGMLEYAYSLKSFHFLDGQVQCHTLRELYDRFAYILAHGVLSRTRKGLYRTYIPINKTLSHLRGRLDVRRMVRHPTSTDLACRFKRHTSDVEENQILAWSLSRIAHGHQCNDWVLPAVRRAYRAIHPAVTITPFNGKDCVGRSYNRLNDDYRPLHMLCRFFLDHTGPSHELGDQASIPFLVNMGRLYELFVAEWLRAHLPSTIGIKVQDVLNIGPGLRFNLDITLFDASTSEVKYILDTKYKDVSHSSTEDVAQVVAYSKAKNCTDAILVYPSSVENGHDVWIGHEIRVRDVAFSLDGDLEQAGQNFMNCLGLTSS
jgi:5-methylcytosine-specific restriction enzyme subunit McrC